MSQEQGTERKRPGESDGFSGGDFKRPRTDRPDKPPCTLRVLVRNRDAGSIIGRGGETIKGLRKQHDCQVVLPDTQGSPDRVLTIMGAQDACLGVIRDVLTALPDHEGKRGEKETQILIPQPFMGTIIGTGGSKVNDLRRRVKALVKIFPEPMPGSNERSIQLVGEVDQICECIWAFLDDIAKKETSREMIYLYEPGCMEEYEPPFYNDHNMRRPPRGRGADFRGHSHGRGYQPRGRGGPPFNSGYRQHGGGPSRPPGTGGIAPPHNPRPRGNGPSPTAPSQQAVLTPPNTGLPPPPQPVPQQQTPALVPSQQAAVIPAGSGSVGYTPALVGYSTPTSNFQPAAPLVVPLSVQQPSVYPVSAAVQYMQPGIPATVPAPTPPTQQSSQQVTIPVNYAEAIIGPGGSRLEGVKAQSACQITINPPSLGSTEQIITIVGNPQGIKLAQELMQNSVRQFHPNV